MELSRIGECLLVAVGKPPLGLLNESEDEELLNLANELSSDRKVGCIILHGHDAQYFSCGDDVSEFPELMGKQQVAQKIALELEAFDAIERLPQPVIAAVSGLALGGGLELALCADVRLSDDTARFGFPEIRLGVFPGSGGLFRLAPLIGESAAKKMMFSGEIFPADYAIRVGLADGVGPNTTALEAATSLGKQLCQMPRGPLRMIKEGVRTARSTVGDDMRKENLRLVSAAFAAADATEGVDAFLHKRQPAFGSLD